MLAPVLVLWLGFGILPKLVVIALVSFFSIVVTTLGGFAVGRPGADQADAHVRRLARRARSAHVELPTALPGVFTGAKIAVVVAVIGAVFAELAGANAGLGYLFEQSIPQLQTARAYAAVVILSVFAIALFALLTLAERLVLPWAYRPREETPVIKRALIADRRPGPAARSGGLWREEGVGVVVGSQRSR